MPLWIWVLVRLGNYTSRSLPWNRGPCCPSSIQRCPSSIQRDPAQFTSLELSGTLLTSWSSLEAEVSNDENIVFFSFFLFWLASGLFVQIAQEDTSPTQGSKSHKKITLMLGLESQPCEQDSPGYHVLHKVFLNTKVYDLPKLYLPAKGTLHMYTGKILSRLFTRRSLSVSHLIFLGKYYICHYRTVSGTQYLSGSITFKVSEPSWLFACVPKKASKCWSLFCSSSDFSSAHVLISRKGDKRLSNSTRRKAQDHAH